MTRTITFTAAIILAFATCSLDGVSAWGQPFSISWYTLDGGGGNSSGGSFELAGTIGQHDAGVAMQAGAYSVTGGFWAGGAAIGGPVETVADSINIFRGLLVGGVLADTFDSDDSRMLFNPGLVLNAIEAPVWLIFDGTLSSDSPATLTIKFESQAGTPGLSATTDAWNWQTNSYDEVNVTAASFNSDAVVAIDLTGGINDYVDAGSGAVRTRIGWRKTGLTINFPWEVRLDQMVWVSQ